MRCSPLLIPALLLAACGGGDHPQGSHVHADGTVHQDEPAPAPAAPAADHGAQHALGALAIGPLTVQVVRHGDAVPGKEADYEVEFPAGTQRPAALRVWVGIESGVGSMKARLANEGDRSMHGPVPVPDPLPAGARLWFESETKDGVHRASLAF
ncbi:MAG: hypothetical protein FJ265_00930 [Planctomycetes bacterium]|nr:hypothetical protein [Planctomycetota bacterium]